MLTECLTLKNVSEFMVHLISKQSVEMREMTLCTLPRSQWHSQKWLTNHARVNSMRMVLLCRWASEPKLGMSKCPRSGLRVWAKECVLGISRQEISVRQGPRKHSAIHKYLLSEYVVTRCDCLSMLKLTQKVSLWGGMILLQ